MKNLISKAGRAIALQAVALASCFAMFSAISTAYAEMPPLPQQMWQGKSDVQVADEARRDPNQYCTQCHETGNATGKQLKSLCSLDANNFSTTRFFEILAD